MKLTKTTKDKLIFAWESIKPEFSPKFRKQIQDDLENAKNSDEIRVLFRTIRAKTKEVESKKQIREFCAKILERMLKTLGI